MTTFSRRKMISMTTASLAGAAGAAGALAAAPSARPDPEMDETERRMTRLEGRGAALSVKEKYLSLFAVIAAQGLAETAEAIALQALSDGVSPVEIKEAVIHTTPYVGIGRARQALSGVNAALAKKGVALPLEPQGTVTDETRLARGIEVQTGIFGDTITRMHEGTPEERRGLIIEDLSGYCFGDFYTRKGLSIQERELVTFCAIAALGGCEPQLAAHKGAALKEGYTKRQLVDALQVVMPYIGFPRTLNAVAVVDRP